MTARRPRRLAALLSVVPLVVAGTVLVAAPAANAATTSLGCRLYFSDAGTGSSPTTYSDTFSWSQAGDTVTVSAAAGTINGPVPVNANQLNVRVLVEWSGGSATLSSSGYPATGMPASVALGSWAASGTVAVAGGTALTVKQVKFDDSSSFNVDTYCSASGDRDQKASPVATSLTYTTTGSASPTTTSASPTTTSASPTTTSASPTTTSASPTTTSGSPTTTSSPTTTAPSNITPVTVSGLNCEIIGSVKAWTKASMTGGTNAADPKFSFGASSLAVAAGDKVTFTVTYNQGPAVGPVDVPAGALKPKGKIKVTGGGGGTATVVAPLNSQMIVGYASGNTNGWIPGNTMTGTWTATAAGTITAEMTAMAFDYGDPATGTTFDWPTKRDDLDSLCDKGTNPKTSPASIGLMAQEGTVETSSPPATTPAASTSTSTDDSSGDGSSDGSDSGNNGTLAATGPGEAFQAMIWALVALQIGLIIVVRAARRRPASASASSGRSARRSSPGQPWARTRGRHR